MGQVSEIGIFEHLRGTFRFGDPRDSSSGPEVGIRTSVNNTGDLLEGRLQTSRRNPKRLSVSYRIVDNSRTNIAGIQQGSISACRRDGHNWQLATSLMEAPPF